MTSIRARASILNASLGFHHLLLVMGLRSISGPPPSQRSLSAKKGSASLMIKRKRPSKKHRPHSHSVRSLSFKNSRNLHPRNRPLEFYGTAHL